MNKDTKIYLLGLSLIVAKQSPDKSTQNGAIIINTDGKIISEGYNRPPVQIKLKQKHFQRPLKYSYFEHAERNAIYDAARHGKSTYHGIMIVPWFSCTDCARAIVEAGILEVVGIDREDNNYSTEKWNESIQMGNKILDECGVKRTYIKLQKSFGVELLRNEKLVKF